MAIKRGSKVDKSFSSSAMTDLMFLLLIFMIIATTLINPNALKLELPKSSNQLKDKAITTVSIEQKGSEYIYYVELEKVSGMGGVKRPSFRFQPFFSQPYIQPLLKESTT